MNPNYKVIPYEKASELVRTLREELAKHWLVLDNNKPFKARIPDFKCHDANCPYCDGEHKIADHDYARAHEIPIYMR